MKSTDICGKKTLAACIVSLLMAFGPGSLAFEVRASDPIPLWPKGALDEKGNVGNESDTTTLSSRRVADKKVIRLGNVTNPTITLYRPSKRKDNGAAVIVCPGGGYSILALDLEGTEVCKWLNSMGVTAVLLKYRVPKRLGDDTHILPLQDAQRALGLVRFHAREWNLDPQRIGVMGFSAGGHLSAHLSNDCDKRAYESVDDADQASCRPDFAMLIYPAYLASKEQKNKLAPEIKVTTNAPPTFLMQTEDDVLGVESSLVYYLALKDAKIPVEMHLYSTGGHGYGLRPSGKLNSSWPKRAEEWLRESGFLQRKRP